MNLPILTTAEDVIKLADYLKTKATGATVAEIGAALGKNVVDGRKLSAYEFLGIVTKEGIRLSLTAQGRELSRSTPANRSGVFREVLRKIPAYHGVLEWLHHQNLESVTTPEIGAHLFQHSKEATGKASETTLGYMSVCFMNFCDAAELGTLTVGRKGKPTRLDVNRENLRAYIDESPIDPRKESTETEPSVEDAAGHAAEDSLSEVETKPKPIFIAHGKDKGPLGQLKKILDDLKIPYKVAMDEPNSGKLIPEKVKSLMRECGSAIFLFTGNEGKNFVNKKGQPDSDRQVPNLNVVFELGAASILYDDRIIIFKEQGVEFATDFNSIGYTPFEKGDIQSKSGDLLKELVALGFIKITTTG